MHKTSLEHPMMHLLVQQAKNSAKKHEPVEHKEVAAILEKWRSKITPTTANQIGGLNWMRLSQNALPKLISKYFTQQLVLANELRSYEYLDGLYQIQDQTLQMQTLLKNTYDDDISIPTRFKEPIEAAQKAILAPSLKVKPQKTAEILRLFNDALSQKEYLSLDHLGRETRRNFVMAAKLPVEWPESNTSIISHHKIDFEKTNLEHWKIQSATTKGSRDYQEDFYDNRSLPIPSWNDITYCAVFDGHGNDEASSFLKNHLWELILSELYSSQDKDAQTKTDLNNIDKIEDLQLRREKAIELIQTISKLALPVVMANAINHAFLKAHKIICSQRDNCGSTAAIVLATDKHLVVGTTGDSEVILGWKAEGKIQAVRTTPPAHPEIDYFKRQIIQRGGYIAKGLDDSLRVNRNGPNLTSALGDASYPMISRPLISHVNIDNFPFKGPLIVVLGTDGLWNDVDPVTAIKYAINKENPAPALVQEALTRGSTDNTTVTVMELKGPESHFDLDITQIMNELSLENPHMEVF